MQEKKKEREREREAYVNVRDLKKKNKLEARRQSNKPVFPFFLRMCLLLASVKQWMVLSNSKVKLPQKRKKNSLHEHAPVKLNVRLVP